MKMADCWFECNDGHTIFVGLVEGFPLIIAHLDKWPVGEIDRQYHENIIPRYRGV